MRENRNRFSKPRSTSHQFFCCDYNLAKVLKTHEPSRTRKCQYTAWSQDRLLWYKSRRQHSRPGQLSPMMERMMDLTTSYQEHFDQRGCPYDLAMQRYPGAQQQEFAQAIAAAKIQPGMLVADVPAGGGYMQNFLPAGCGWLGHEPCESFINHGAVATEKFPLLPLPWREATVDAAISLAGIHHIDDKHPLFAELHRVVKPGGRLVVSDVATGSSVARFLDGYVGTHNSTGHKGMYLDDHTLIELSTEGWTIQSYCEIDFHWAFPDRHAMADFCHEFFDLRTSSVTDTQAAIEAQLGVTDLLDGTVGMMWSLMTIIAQKP
jgi:SAM-dependent methyltransferase